MKFAPVILGIVAEYDPFHNGHAWHLSQARKAVQPDSVYVVLSSCLKQRGEPAMLSPYDRACCALRAGADAVFSLPVLWTIRDAEHYALGAVSLLCGLGITHIAFGAETPDIEKMKRVADFLENPPSGFPDELHALLSSGMGYPAALSGTVSRFLPAEGEILSSPNNILAICYLRALRKLNTAVIPVIIPRRNGYHESVIRPEAPSASSLRSALIRGDYSNAFSAVPDFAASIIRRAFLSSRIPFQSVWDTLLLEKLRTSDLSLLPDISEGLDDALKKAAVQATSSEELVEQLSSRRYTASRIRRLFAYAMLSVTNERIRALPLPAATLLLSLRKKNVPTDTWKNLPVHIAVSASQWRDIADPEDLAAWRLWASCCRMDDTLPFTERIYTE